MKKLTDKAIAVGTPVSIDIAQGLAVARGIIAEVTWANGWLYRVDVTEGDACDEHRNALGELWVCHFEVTPLAITPADAQPQ